MYFILLTSSDPYYKNFYGSGSGSGKIVPADPDLAAEFDYSDPELTNPKEIWQKSKWISSKTFKILGKPKSVMSLKQTSKEFETITSLPALIFFYLLMKKA